MRKTVSMKCILQLLVVRLCMQVMMLIVRLIRVVLKQSRLTNQDSRHIYKAECIHHSSGAMVTACYT